MKLEELQRVEKVLDFLRSGDIPEQELREEGFVLDPRRPIEKLSPTKDREGYVVARPQVIANHLFGSELDWAYGWTSQRAVNLVSAILAATGWEYDKTLRGWAIDLEEGV